MYMRGVKIPKSDSRNRRKEHIMNIFYLHSVTDFI